MKNGDKLIYLFNNLKKLQFYIFFLLFSLNCSSQKIQDKSTSPILSARKTHVVFSNFKTDSKLSIYSEKFSQKGSILVLREGKFTPNVVYAEYILSTVAPESIELTQSIFKVEIPRFALSEKIYVGNFIQKDQMETMEIELERVYTRTRQGKKLEDLFELKFSPDYKESEVLEKLVFLPKKDFSLWKVEEWAIQNQKLFLWRNYEKGMGMPSDISFSEFASPFGNLYSKINFPREYLYIFLRDSNPISLYSFYDFEIAADLKPFLLIGDNSKSTKPLSLNKNSLPKLYIHKILNTNGN